MLSCNVCSDVTMWLKVVPVLLLASAVFAAEPYVEPQSDPYSVAPPEPYRPPDSYGTAPSEPYLPPDQPEPYVPVKGILTS